MISGYTILNNEEKMEFRQFWVDIIYFKPTNIFARSPKTTKE